MGFLPWRQVAFRTHYGRFICADDNGTYPADRETARHWEHYSIEAVDNGAVAIRNAHGKYLGSGSATSRLASFDTIVPEAQWWLRDAPKGKFTLKNRATKKFLCAPSAFEHPIVDRTDAGAWEEFDVVSAPLRVETQDGVPLWPWEPFEIVELSEGIVGFKTAAGGYLGSGSNGRIDSDSKKVTDAHQWRMCPIGPPSSASLFTFQNAATNKFMSLLGRNEILVANRDVPDRPERFTVAASIA
ncbi:unnamed protein product (mitochondrion) [Plasmodiophora brassicae]|uniref:Fascin-like domain-containing protein n=1 Tax=Plasmodiophora brassicae TaxID=37360 RepID=A0A0G4INR4_PLABS|nr:hypothetical protein PBRA_005438 [Plasmodiophora brassicae]SPR01791.1 unnamed protein product [Plasmodiophora brassicae]